MKYLLCCLLFLSTLSCSTPKEVNHGSVCVVFQWIPIDPISGETYSNIPPKTFITCDSEQTARRIFQESAVGEDS